ncbi:MAG TPA: FkbM family methyltransferase [Pyrinomonadaceae bacterium]|jgi:FkbM family methyltransferase
MIRRIIPAGVLRTFEWRTRFKDAGLNSKATLLGAASKANRDALVASRIEHLPRALRSNLPFVIDIGANTGQWLSALQKLVRIEKAEVFEPNPEAFEILRSRLGHNANYRFHRDALGMQAGVSTLRVTCESSLASLLPPSKLLEEQYAVCNARVVNEIQVSVTTLDAALPGDEAIDLLKIDVQGFERPVLLGGVNTLRRTRALLIEMNFVSHYEGDDSFASLTDLLTGQLGFEFWDMSLPHRGVDGRALWSDAVFINPGMCPAGGWGSAKSSQEEINRYGRRSSG